jgi:hypothetical protein
MAAVGEGSMGNKDPCSPAEVSLQASRGSGYAGHAWGEERGGDYRSPVREAGTSPDEE